ncbi:hypothetical protein [Pseudomonas sp. Irchel s3h17]|uniref:hypothetical protein n=1 Tax=Pseudomonas sp. Irchel s3h17 TaxID=2009182 RepID=UPI000BA300C2|nr:hypothetical protein [Pseudomonas sp. Irchel s3h17]
MSDPYIEDDGAEYPVNNCVRCGQTDYVSSFAGVPAEPGHARLSTVTRATAKPFMPKVAAPVRKPVAKV